jgi:integrase/recombinase XerD
MRVFQPTYTGRDGKQKKTPRFHVTFEDHNQTRRRVIGYTDERATESLGRKLESLAAFRANNDPMPPDLARWLDGIDDDLRTKLIEWRLIDSRASMAAKPLTEHVDDWHDDLVNGGKTEAHAELVKARVNHVFTGSGFIRYADINEAEVNRYLADKRKEGLSIRTTNFYMKSTQQFCRWMVRNRRANDLPLVGLQPQDAETDRRLIRRALTVDELGKLIQTAQKGATWNKTTGAERALVYRLATETGLRRNEIRTLTAGSFDLDSEQPTVTVAVTYSKRRQTDVLPLRSELAAALRLHFATKLPAARAFNLSKLTAKMLADDLRAAGIATDTEEGVVDFHSLRVTFVTNLARGGVHPKVAQTLARHSTVELTMQTYTKMTDKEQRTGLDALPVIPMAVSA